MKAMVAGMICAVVWCVAPVNAQETNALFQLYDRSDPVPQDLSQFYERLIAVLQTGKVAQIATFCLPEQVEITIAPRPDNPQFPDTGNDLNLAFIRRGHFDKVVVDVRKDSDSEYVLRTSSTAMWFKRESDGTWKLARYLDRPID